MTSTHSGERGRLVLLCGISGDADGWILSGLQGSTHLYPGHGGRKAQPGWTIQQIADEVASTYEGPLDLLGTAFGGSVVQNLLVRYPERVRSAVIACGGAPGQGERIALGEGPIADLRGVPDAQTRQKIADTARRDGMKDVAETFVRRWFTPYAIRTRHPGVEYSRGRLLAMGGDAFGDIYLCSSISEKVTPAQLQAVRHPVTIIAGTSDLSVGLSGPAALHGLIPNSRLEILPGPHMLHLEQPESFAAAVDRHFIWMPIGNRVEAPLGASGG